MASAAGAVGSSRQSYPPPVLAPLGDSAPTPTAAAVLAALGARLSAPALGGGLVGEVLDGPSGAVLWSRRPTVPVLVASTQKLLVAAAALDVLGPGHTADTALLSAGPVAAGVLTGDLYLRGTGDVLLSASATSGWPARGTLDELAAGLAARGVRRVAGTLVADATAFTGPPTAPGWRPTYVTLGSVAPVTALEVDRGQQAGTLTRSPDPALQAVTDLRAALARRHIAVVGGALAGPTPAAAVTLARVSGPPVAVGVGEMLQESDNDAAESFGRQLASDTHRPATFAGGAAAILAALTAAGLPTTGTAITDASGLSRADRVTPALLGAVLQAAVATRPAWRPILAGLPVADFTGTLRGRDTGPAGRAAAGVVRAKTGNLEGVTALAGTVVDAAGRQLVYVFVTDAAVGLTASEAALDALAASLAPL